MLEGRAPVARRGRLVVAAALGVVLAIGGAYAALRGTRGPRARHASPDPAGPRPAGQTLRRRDRRQPARSAAGGLRDGVRPDCTTPLAGAVVHLWQANGEGVYGPGPRGPARSGAATCRAPCGPTHAAATGSRRSSRRTTRAPSLRRPPTSTWRSATRQPGCC